MTKTGLTSYQLKIIALCTMTLLQISPDPYFGYPQRWMILAAPFMLLYNGEKGSRHKWFFYLYYPVHRYLFEIMEYLYLSIQ